MYGYQPGMGGAGRDRITQALMNIQNPPPRTVMPGAAPGSPTGMSVQASQPPTSTTMPMQGGGMPGAMPGGSPGSLPPMSMQGMPGAMNSPQLPPMPGQQPQQLAQPPAAGQQLY